MGIGLPMAAYVIAQGGSVDPGAGVNRRNLDMIDAFALRLEREGILKSDVFFGHDRAGKNCFTDRAFETNLTNFPKLSELKDVHKYFTVVMPTQQNFEIISNSTHIPHVFHILGSNNHPIIIAKDWMEIMSSKNFDRNKCSLLRDNAINMKFKAIKSIEQTNYRARHMR